MQAESAQAWEEKYNQAVAAHEAQLQQLRFDHSLDAAIASAGGRNAVAIRALLDIPVLQASEDQPHAMEAALESLRKESGYLFETEKAPPYARGTGAWQGANKSAPTSLAGALKERFERK